MNVDKGDRTINIIFGAFLVVSIVRTGVAIYEWSEKRKGKQQCKCSGK